MGSCQLDFGHFFSILSELKGLQGNRRHQPGSREYQFGFEGHHRHEKVHKGHRGRQTFEINFDKDMWIDLIFEPLKW